MDGLMKIYTDFAKSLPNDITHNLDKTIDKLTSFKVGDFLIKELFESSVHLLNRKGKLLRPTLVFLGSHILKEKSQKFIDLAMAIELLHVSSLVHDDIIDKEEFRRNIKSVNTKYGIETAILAGDALISKAVELASPYGKDVIRAISDVSLQMCAGELLDYSCQKGNLIKDIDKYLKIARFKTASLIGTSCNIIAIHNKNNAKNALYNYGINIGMAFQIRDDILDFIGEDSSKMSNSDMKGMNIVSVIKEKDKIPTKDALDKAAKLNQKYIDMAIKCIKDRNFSDILEPYARMISINPS